MRKQTVTGCMSCPFYSEKEYCEVSSEILKIERKDSHKIPPDCPLLLEPIQVECMRSAEEIDQILSQIKSKRSKMRWCKSGSCGCVGCVNVSEKMRVGYISESEHTQWKEWKKSRN